MDVIARTFVIVAGVFAPTDTAFYIVLNQSFIFQYYRIKKSYRKSHKQHNGNYITTPLFDKLIIHRLQNFYFFGTTKLVFLFGNFTTFVPLLPIKRIYLPKRVKQHRSENILNQYRNSTMFIRTLPSHF